MSLTNVQFGLSASSFAANKSLDPHTTGVPTVPGQSDLRAEYLGSGASDTQQLHGSRCRRTCDWFRNQSFGVILAITETCEECVEILQAAFFGHDGTCVTLNDLVDRTRSPISACLESLWQLLCTFKDDKEGEWSLLSLINFTRWDDEETRLIARAQSLGLQSEIDMRFDKKVRRISTSVG